MLIEREQLESFEQNGFLLLRNVLDPATVEVLRERGDRLVDSGDPFFRTADEEFHGLRNLLFLDPAFLQLVDLQAVLLPVIQILGFNIHLSSLHLSHIRSRDPARPWRGDWHTDIFGFEDDLREHTVRVGLKCAFALTRHDKPDSGVTILMPGTHRARGSVVLDRHDPAPLGAVQLPMNAGDCLVFENRVRHSRGHNTSGHTRKCVLVGYTFKWVMPLDSLDGFEVPEESLSPIAKDLLPRPYGVPGNGALEALCHRHSVPLRPAFSLV
jgi:ectoine hydroxylase